MISAWHLVWIVPASMAAGAILLIVIAVAIASSWED